MHHLGIATTRSVVLALTGEQVLRDKLYDGNAANEPGALLTRMAPSFLRFGSFELFAAAKDIQTMRKLADYVIDHFYADCKSENSYDYNTWFQQICNRTLTMVIDWQRVGFVHGVMNTDNMSILGLTLDYGPYGFLEEFDLDWTPNTSDREARYAYGKQGEIALWNLWKLASAIYPLIDDAKPLEAALEKFKTNYEQEYVQMIYKKIGLRQVYGDDLVYGLVTALEESAVDMTIFFRELAGVQPSMRVEESLQILEPSFYQKTDLKNDNYSQLKSWLQDYLVKLQEDLQAFKDAGGRQGDGENYALAKARTQKMNSINPKYVLRNYMAQIAIVNAEKGDYALMDELYLLLKRPYNEQPDMEKWYARRPDWATESQDCTQLSCSS